MRHRNSYHMSLKKITLYGQREGTCINYLKFVLSTRLEKILQK